jgi:hypothetical protein
VTWPRRWFGFTIERVIGRLLTDEELRLTFTRSPRQTVAELSEQGWELSRLEVDALLATEIVVIVPSVGLTPL